MSSSARLIKVLSCTTLLSLPILAFISLYGGDKEFSRATVASEGRLIARSLLRNIDVGRTVDDAEKSLAQSYVGCLLFPAQGLSRHKIQSADMHPMKCVQTCRGWGYNYAALAEATKCHCSSWTGEGAVHVGRCSYRCAGKPTAFCGGKSTADVYRVYPAAADEGPWTPWMKTVTTIGTKTDGYAIRYRLCPSLAAGSLDCVAKGTRRMARDSSAETRREELSRYVGCFVFGREPLSTAVRWGGAVRDCALRCAAVSKAYALVSFVNKTCRCSDSLGIARPFSSCGRSPPGVAVYSTVDAERQGRTVVLKFDAAPRRRKVIVASHHRRTEGVYFNRLLTIDDRALHLTEPESAFWEDPNGDVNVTARQVLSQFLRYLESQMTCDVERLPAAWVYSFKQRGALQQTGWTDYRGCQLKHGPEACLPMFQTICEASPIVSVSTALLSEAEALRRFAVTDNGTVIFHVMRDPMAIASLMKKLTGRRVDRYSAGRLCSRIAGTRSTAAALARSGRDVHTVHFEDAEDDGLAPALAFYRKIWRASLDSEERGRVARLAARLDSIAASGAWKAAAPPTAGLSAIEQRAIESACKSVIYGE